MTKAPTASKISGQLLDLPEELALSSKGRVTNRSMAIAPSRERHSCVIANGHDLLGTNKANQGFQLLPTSLALFRRMPAIGKLVARTMRMNRDDVPQKDRPFDPIKRFPYDTGCQFLGGAAARRETQRIGNAETFAMGFQMRVIGHRQPRTTPALVTKFQTDPKIVRSG